MYGPTSVTAFEDVVVIPCLKGEGHGAQNPFLYQAQQEGDSCQTFRLHPPAVDYDPMRGVRMRVSQVSEYADHPFLCCSGRPLPGDCSSPFCVQFKVRDPPDLVVKPAMPALGPLRVYSEEGTPVKVGLECSSWGRVEFSTAPGGSSGALNSSTHSVRQTRPGAVAPRYEASLELELQTGASVRVECRLAEQGNDTEALYVWNISAHDIGPRGPAPRYLTFAGGELRRLPFIGLYRPSFRCSSDVYTDARLSVINCFTAAQCRLLEWCFESDQCRSVVSSGQTCQDRPEGARSCQETQTQTLGALFRCTAGGHAFTQLRWTGLGGSTSFVFDERTRRSGPRDATLGTEIIRVLGARRESDSPYYTHLPYNFTCLVHPFWSVGRTRFFFGFSGYDDDSLEPASGPTVLVKEPAEREGYVERVRLIIPSSSVDRIVCEAPLQDNEWIRATVGPLRVIESVKPEILNVETSFHFEVDDTSSRIRCEARGEPSPVIRWTKEGVDGRKAAEIKSAPDSSGLSVINGSILHFAKVRRGLEGSYTCTASNGAGETSTDFTVTLSGEESDASTAWILAGAIVAGFLTLLVPILVVLRRRVFKRRRVLDEVEMDRFRKGSVASTGGGQQEPNLERRGFDPTFEISKKKLSIDKTRKLGAGEYGKVYAGKARLEPGGDKVEVAIKVPKRFCPEPILEGLLKELRVMTRLQHENIVTLLRANTSGAAYGELYILMEFCAEGSVDKFFERNRVWYVEVGQRDFDRTGPGPSGSHLPGADSNYHQVWELPSLLQATNQPPTPPPARRFEFVDLVRWCGEVASGMEYLASVQVVHRDLAARNVLLTAELRAKVSDFGLSRQLYGSAAYQLQSGDLKLPCRWMAFECLRDGRFSTQSDVWAFGIFAWEVFSLGALPYTHTQFVDAAHFAALLGAGLRIKDPQHSTPQIFGMLEECWREEPCLRPSFTRLKNFFANRRDETESEFNIHADEVSSPES